MGNEGKPSTGWNKYTGIHTINFLDGNHILGGKFGLNKTNNRTTYDTMVLGGYHSSTKKPCVVALGTVEKKYNTNNKNLWFSQEGYLEVVGEKGVFASKVTYAPLKVNGQVGKSYLFFNPRGAINFDGKKVTADIETLTGIGIPIAKIKGKGKEKTVSFYTLLQTYGFDDFFHKNNTSVNVGFTYNF